MAGDILIASMVGQLVEPHNNSLSSCAELDSENKKLMLEKEDFKAKFHQSKMVNYLLTFRYGKKI